MCVQKLTKYCAVHILQTPLDAIIIVIHLTNKEIQHENHVMWNAWAKPENLEQF